MHDYIVSPAKIVNLHLENEKKKIFVSIIKEFV